MCSFALAVPSLAESESAMARLVSASFAAIRSSEKRSLMFEDQNWRMRKATVAQAAKAVMPPAIISPHQDRPNQVLAVSRSAGSSDPDFRTGSMLTAMVVIALAPISAIIALALFFWRAY